MCPPHPLEDLVSRIGALERQSRLLDPGVEERRLLTDHTTAYAASFLSDIAERPAFFGDPAPAAEIFEHPVKEDGKSIDEVLSILKRSVDVPGLNPASGGHLGYIPGGGIYASALADYLADVSNNYAGIHFAGPGAVNIENHLIKWMADIVGFPSDCGGNLSSGGSIASLIAIVSARDAKNVLDRGASKCPVYMTEQRHHSLDKALRIAGLPACPQRLVEMDLHYRMKSDILETMIRKDIAAGLKPWLVVANAGSTDTGAVDPLDDISSICRKNKIWMHVDAAYGGFFILTESCRNMLQPMSGADSIVLDPHKGLFLPYGLGAVLVKDRNTICKSHHYTANYMQDAPDPYDNLSPAYMSPELTKHFRGLRMWLPLMLHGLAPFRSCLEEKRCLALYFYKAVGAMGFETGPEPQLSVVCYRYVPEKEDADAFNKKLLDRLHQDGRVFVSSTILNGNFTLRFACLSFRTHLKTVNVLLDMIRQALLDLGVGLA